MLNEMVQKLDRIAKATGNHEYIYGQGQNEEEKQKNKESLYKCVKFFYIKPKGGQSAVAKQSNENCIKILSEYMSSQPNDLFDVPYAERGHQMDSVDVDVDATAVSKRPKLSNQNKNKTNNVSTKGRQDFHGAFLQKGSKKRNADSRTYAAQKNASRLLETVVQRPGCSSLQKII